FYLYLASVYQKTVMEEKEISRFNQTIQEFDAINAQDPHTETVDGEEVPKELLYSKRMSEMLEKFYPQASGTLRLAARCQHIQRWTIPREDFPMDRNGYLLWRTKLKKYHGELAGSIMKDNGYDQETIRKVDEIGRAHV